MRMQQTAKELKMYIKMVAVDTRLTFTFISGLQCNTTRYLKKYNTDSTNISI